MKYKRVIKFIRQEMALREWRPKIFEPRYIVYLPRINDEANVGLKTDDVAEKNHFVKVHGGRVYDTKLKKLISKTY